MRLLFVHQNFPGQYRHLARWLAARPGCEVVALGEKANVLRQKPAWPGLKLFGYQLPAVDEARFAPFDAPLHRALHRGRTVAGAAAALRRAGFAPDVIFAHLGWGESIFLKEIFPQARVLLYCEFFYRASGADLGFDSEFPPSEASRLRVRLLNAPFLMALDAADAGVAPTAWQQRQFPSAYAGRISTVHDGVDTDIVAPRPRARWLVPGTDVVLTERDEVVTYVARNLEPYRGFHVFMRAIPEIQRRRPGARIVIVGGDEVSYSPRLRPGDSYRARLLRELAGNIDLARVHMTGRIPYADYLELLRVSSAHVYLTYPFVLSWSLIEALAAGCLVIGSRTPPVEEVIEHRRNGLLVDFFSTAQIAAAVDEALGARQELRPLREAARRTAQERYDLKRICLPAQIKLVERLAPQRAAPVPA